MLADMTDALERIVPYDGGDDSGGRSGGGRSGSGSGSGRAPLYRHAAEGDDDMPAHVKSSLVGAHVCVPVTNGALALGTWQGIWYLEFRRARHTRTLVATVQGEAM